MKIACLILAHKNPEQITDLIDLLSCDEIDFFVHLDKKVNKKSFEHIENNNVFFIKNRVSVKWATFSLIQATLNSLSEIVQRGGYDYINFISGQDLPIKSKTEIIQFLEQNRGKEFITCIPYSPLDKWWIENEERVFKYNFQNWIIPFKYRIQKIVNLLTPKRVSPNGITITGNSQWFCITSECTRYVIEAIKKDKKIMQFFQYVWGADEFFFSTIVYNSPFKERIKENITYVDWELSHNGHPKILTMDDFEKISNSDKLFARKFDSSVDNEIIKKLKSLYLGK